LSNIYDYGQLLSKTYGSPYYATPEMPEGKSYKGSILTLYIWSAEVVFIL
jgi:hypothetical protein